MKEERIGDALLKKIREMAIRLFRRVITLYPSDVNVTRAYRFHGAEFRVFISNEHEEWRWNEMVAGRKEPETIEWIDTFMKPGEVFVDIGACIGNYSLYAAARHPGLKVYAFEPEPNSLIQLVKNAHINNLPVACFMIPLADGRRIDSFRSYPVYARAGGGEIGRHAFIAGESNHQFGRTISADGETFHPTVEIGMAGCALDELIGSGVVPMPNHIKIDVDGLEGAILKGARTVLSGKALQSILCEISGKDADVQATVALVKAAGFAVVRHPSGGAGNFIFRRETR